MAAIERANDVDARVEQCLQRVDCGGVTDHLQSGLEVADVSIRLHRHIVAQKLRPTVEREAQDIAGAERDRAVLRDDILTSDLGSGAELDQSDRHARHGHYRGPGLIPHLILDRTRRRRQDDPKRNFPAANHEIFDKPERNDVLSQIRVNDLH